MTTPKTIPITVDSRLRIPIDALPEEVADKLREEFTHENPDYAKAKKRLARRSWGKDKEPAVAKVDPTWSEEEHAGVVYMTLPRGGLGRAREVLKDVGLESVMSDRRAEGTGPRPVGYKLAAHIDDIRFQREMVEAALKKQNCLVRGPTGSGKSTVAARIAITAGLCTLVLVQTRELFEQWKRRMVSDLGLSEDDVGIIHGAKSRIRPITIAMVQTFAKKAGRYKGVFGVVIFDEVQRAAAKTFYPAVDASDAKYRVGISADETRKDKKDYLIYDVFGRVAADVKREDLERDGFILPVETRLVLTDFEAPWYAELTPEEKQDDGVFDRLVREMSADEERNKLAASIAVEQARGDHVVLVFSHRVEHCALLRANIAAKEPRVGIFVGHESYRRESDATSAGLRAGSVRIAVGTYQSIGTGVDVPAADRGVATTPVHSNKQGFGQNRGRLCRIDRSPGATKKDAILFVLWDRFVHGLAPLRNLLRFNKGNVTVMNPRTGAIEDGRSFLRRAEDEGVGIDVAGDR